MADAFERILKIGIWITATILFGWVWIKLLMQLCRNTVSQFGKKGEKEWLK